MNPWLLPVFSLTIFHLPLTKLKRGNSVSFPSLFLMPDCLGNIFLFHFSGSSACFVQEPVGFHRSEIILNIQNDNVWIPNMALFSHQLTFPNPNGIFLLRILLFRVQSELYVLSCIYTWMYVGMNVHQGLPLGSFSTHIH